MSFTIYALRLKGDPEVRYVGQTANLEQRFQYHRSYCCRIPWHTTFTLWLKNNAGAIECVEIGTAPTREEARLSERAAINLCLALGHRLFNRHLVPAEKRLPDRDETCGPADYWSRAA